MAASKKVFVANRSDLESLCKRRFFYRQSADIYGGAAGFFTYGPPGCAVKNNMINLWRQHFCLEEQLLEIEDTCIMLESVLKASGHVERFNDFIVKDSKDESKFYRADKLLEEFMEKKITGTSSEPLKKEYQGVINQADAYGKEELMAIFATYGITAPETGNPLTEPKEFNLMFPTPIGPSGLIHGYLRPELAQGIFLNYKFCLEQNGNNLPMGVAQIGKSFRNEIAPRAGLTRQREFSQMEIEYFVKPHDKAHPKFVEVQDIVCNLFSAPKQLAAENPVQMTFKEAVETKLVNNETLGYFMARTYLFLMKCGIKNDHFRFRQHLPTEMAHYACDCWDVEIETCYGWLECVGMADRSCFDLNAHATAAKVDLSYREKLDEAIEVEVTSLTKQCGIAVMKHFKKPGRAVKEYLDNLPSERLKCIANEADTNGESTIEIDGEKHIIPKGLLSLETKTEKKNTNVFTPGVIEPSFGVDRILFSILEHAYYARAKEDNTDDKQTRGVLALPAIIAPYKVTVLPLDQRITRDEKYAAVWKQLRMAFGQRNLSYTVDETSATLGKRYARNDELGIPYAITVDFDSFDDKKCTLRERDSCTQIRLPLDEVSSVVKTLIGGDVTWGDMQERYPEQKQSASTKVGV
eukprot:GEMP01016843.1.p1 GENE.GEMP01016843.1~~GEMP01016843.1.p1  ORF type:complete len:637 (+),score=163.03 GEMP01016843.1:103-2013(+)